MVNCKQVHGISGKLAKGHGHELCMRGGTVGQLQTGTQSIIKLSKSNSGNYSLQELVVCFAISGILINGFRSLQLSLGMGYICLRTGPRLCEAAKHRPHAARNRLYASFAPPACLMGMPRRNKFTPIAYQNTLMPTYAITPASPNFFQRGSGFSFGGSAVVSSFVTALASTTDALRAGRAGSAGRAATAGAGAIECSRRGGARGRSGRSSALADA